MYKIKTLNKISETGLSKLDPEKYTCGEDITNPDAIIVRSAPMHDMELEDSLLAIARAGAGVNNIPLGRCSEKGIVVFNTPGANANAVKELVICGLLLASRKINRGIEWCRTIGNEPDVAKAVEKGKSAFAGPEIKGKTLGVIGLGAIGRLVANAASALEMDVIGYDPYLTADAASNLNYGVKVTSSLDDIYAVADYITLHVPMNDETKGMVCSESIAKMKDDVRVLNFARGGLVNSADVVSALDSGKMAAYVTDFPDENLIDVPGVIAIPHLGASTPESEENCAVMAANQIKDYIETGNIVNSVNMPNVSTPRRGVARLTVIHKNQPNMIKSITDTVSSEGVNIEAFEDKNRGEIGYSILDLDIEVPESVVEKIASMEGVTKVRLIKG